MTEEKKSIPELILNSTLGSIGYIAREIGKLGAKTVLNSLPSLFLWGIWNFLAPQYPVSWFTFWAGLTFIDIAIDSVIPKKD
jgi:hypothetical protein